MPEKTLKIGVLGGGDVALVVHLPVLLLLSHLFEVRTICDVSRKTANHCAAKFHIPRATTNAGDILDDKDIDVVFVLTSDEFHEPYATAALLVGNNVFVEKPITLSLKSAQKIIEAEKVAPNGARFDDVPSDAGVDRESRLGLLLSEAWGVSVDQLSAAQVEYCCLLATLGSHGLSLMRDVLAGLPEAVLASTDNARWYTAMFDYRNRSGTQDRYAVVYESGIDSVPRFDSEVAVFGEKKAVRICYDTPFVKGLGIAVEADELNDLREKCHRSLETSYEDAYTAELKDLHTCITTGKEFKTTAVDDTEDLKLFKTMMDKYPEHNKKWGNEQKQPSGFLPPGP